MNFYLLLEWHKCMRGSPCYFVDLFTISGHKCDFEPEEIVRFKNHKIFGEDDCEPMKMKPVVFVVLRGNHYFTVCFDYERDEAWVFGRMLGVDSVSWKSGYRWGDWDGDLYWKKVAQLFGWRVSSEPDGTRRIHACDVPQVGTPSAFFILFLFSHSNFKHPLEWK